MITGCNSFETRNLQPVFCVRTVLLKKEKAAGIIFQTGAEKDFYNNIQSILK